jgi:hypothetical protein
MPNPKSGPCFREAHIQCVGTTTFAQRTVPCTCHCHAAARERKPGELGTPEGEGATRERGSLPGRYNV